MKKLLVLGGTRFIGRVLVEHLIEAGYHDVTLFSRGLSNPGLFPNLRHIHGDRYSDDVFQVATEDWDVILDISCYFPHHFRQLLPRLKGRVGRYCFMSTGSVYERTVMWDHLATEDTPLCAWTEADLASPDPYVNYEHKKAACEACLLDSDWLDVIMFRPTIVVGKYDAVDCFYYWLHRIQHRDRILLPGNGREHMNLTFVDDLARAVIRAIEVPTRHRVYNATTTPIMTLHAMFTTMAEVLDKAPEFVNLSQALAEAHGLRPWVDLPMCSNYDGRSRYTMDHSQLTQDLDLTFASFREVVEKTIPWYRDRGWPACQAGISADKEAELLRLIDA